MAYQIVSLKISATASTLTRHRHQLESIPYLIDTLPYLVYVLSCSMASALHGPDAQHMAPVLDMRDLPRLSQQHRLRMPHAAERGYSTVHVT